MHDFIDSFSDEEQDALDDPDVLVEPSEPKLSSDTIDTAISNAFNGDFEELSVILGEFPEEVVNYQARTDTFVFLIPYK